MSSASSAAGTATFSAVAAPAPGIIVSGAERYRPIAVRTASRDGQRGSESVTGATAAAVVITSAQEARCPSKLRRAPPRAQQQRLLCPSRSQCREGAPRYRPASTLEAAEDCDAAGDGCHTGELGLCEPLAEEDDSGERREGGELRREDGADRDAVAGADRGGRKPPDLPRPRE